MNLDWILSPLTVYAGLGLGLTASISLYVFTKLELGQLRARTEQSSADLAKKLAAIESAVSALAAEPPPPPAPVFRASINLTKRAQALRMSRRGESLESISAALGVPRKEVELLLKVHDLGKTGG